MDQKNNYNIINLYPINQSKEYSKKICLYFVNLFINEFRKKGVNIFLSLNEKNNLYGILFLSSEVNKIEDIYFDLINEKNSLIKKKKKKYVNVKNLIKKLKSFDHNQSIKIFEDMNSFYNTTFQINFSEKLNQNISTNIVYLDNKKETILNLSFIFKKIVLPISNIVVFSKLAKYMYNKYNKK